MPLTELQRMHMEFCQYVESALWLQTMVGEMFLLAWLSQTENPDHPDPGRRKGSSKSGFMVLFFAVCVVIFITGSVMLSWGVR